MVQLNRLFRKGKRYESPPPPDPRNANATGGKPMAFSARAGIRSSFKFANVPIDHSNTQGGDLCHR